jgi:hypothetical protein
MADFLEGKPRGFCPWCDGKFFSYGVKDRFPVCVTSDCNYDNMESEDENRIRYAAQRLEESKLWNKIAKEGGENA